MNRREPHPLSARVICKYDNRVDLNQIKSGGTAVYYENITVLTSLIDSSGFFLCMSAERRFVMKLITESNYVKELYESGNYDIVPVAGRILSDYITPIELIKILKSRSSHAYMLESAQNSEKWGRYTYLGYDPVMTVTASNGVLNIDGREIKTENPAEYIRKLLSDYRSPRMKGLPTFTGGLVGYFSYDYFALCEPAARTDAEDTEGFKDLDLMLFDKVIAYDHVCQNIILIVNMKAKDGEEGYKAAVDELKNIEAIIKSDIRISEKAGRLLSQPMPMYGKEEYCAMVEKAKAYIREGDIFQVVLSNRLSADFEGSLLNTYRCLRTINPSPYMFYFSGTDVEVAGASPETLVKLENGVLHTYPLAGTRKRGADEEEDKKLEAELLADEKELAEHNMLVDLGRNDLGKISEFGSVKVERLRSIERYSHVMHIGSMVGGKIRADKDALDAIEAVLPAGTLSGAPKIRACQIIGELEKNKRGIYGGAIGYIDFAGNMDTCIAIRIAYKKNGKVFVRSGAGIVGDSVPEKEYEECLNKAKAVINALVSAGEEDEL